MSPEQQKQLIEIRKRKQELLLEIQVSINRIMTWSYCSYVPSMNVWSAVSVKWLKIQGKKSQMNINVKFAELINQRHISTSE